MDLGGEKYMLLTTFRRNGDAVSTPVWVVALDDGSFGFWTSSASGKAKRLAHTSNVMVQPSDARGKVTSGSPVSQATARIVTGPEFEEIRTKVTAKYGWMTKLTPVLAAIGGTIKRKRFPYGDIGVKVSLPA
jgi:PPOX class probable F420-dependent enzyme